MTQQLAYSPEPVTLTARDTLPWVPTLTPRRRRDLAARLAQGTENAHPRSAAH